jgi:hypothetical protein
MSPSQENKVNQMQHEIPRACVRSMNRPPSHLFIHLPYTTTPLHWGPHPPAPHARMQRASPKLHRPNTPPILHMLQIQLLILFTLGMEINPTNTAIPLTKTNVIKPLETRARDRFHAVVRHEEVFFPAHENMLPLLVVLQRERGRGFGGRFRQRAPGGEARPVLQVDFFRGAPGGVGGFEEVFGADYFAFEEGC